jgi:transcriptional regulator with XRE-family HTH domain
MLLSGFPLRLHAARLHLAAVEGRTIGDAELARRVAKRLPSGRMDESLVGKWRRGTVPSVAKIAALAQECDVDPGWLAFGDRSTAPAPEQWAAVAISADAAIAAQAQRQVPQISEAKEKRHRKGS